MSLSGPIIAVLAAFEPLFTQPTWRKALVLLVGCLLVRGRRTVTAVLRVMGQQHNRHFSSFHQVLNRARWSPLAVSRCLLQLVVTRFVPPADPVIVVIDEHLERRWGATIPHRGHYRDSALSSAGHPVSSSGLRWICVAVVVRVPWTAQQWALPFLVILTHPPAADTAAGRQHKTLSGWAQQVVRVLRHWLPDRAVVLLGDTAYSTLDLAAVCVAEQVTLVVPCHLDAGLYAPAPPRHLQTSRKPRVKGLALPKLATRLHDTTTIWCRERVTWYAQGERELEWCSGAAVWYRGGKRPVAIRWVLMRDPQGKLPARAYLATDPRWTVEQVLTTYQRRWSIEVTLEESRAHLGIETQRQWSERAITRSTPALLGLYSVVALLGQALYPTGAVPVSQAAWYAKEQATFSDVLAAVRVHLWHALDILHPGPDPECVIIRRADLGRLLQAAAA